MSVARLSSGGSAVKSRTLVASGSGTSLSTGTPWYSLGVTNYTAPAGAGIVTSAWGNPVTVTVDGVANTFTHGGLVMLPYQSTCVISSGYAMGVTTASKPSGASPNVQNTRASIYRGTGSVWPQSSWDSTTSITGPGFLYDLTWTNSAGNNQQSDSNYEWNLSAAVGGTVIWHMQKTGWLWRDGTISSGLTTYPLYVPWTGTLAIRNWGSKSLQNAQDGTSDMVRYSLTQ